MQGSDLRGRGCTRSQQGGQVGTADVLINAEVSEELGKAVLGIQARGKQEARAIMVQAQFWMCTAFLREEGHHVEGILSEGLVRAKWARWEDQDIVAGREDIWDERWVYRTHGRAGGTCRTRASRLRLRAMSVDTWLNPLRQRQHAPVVGGSDAGAGVNAFALCQRRSSAVMTCSRADVSPLRTGRLPKG